MEAFLLSCISRVKRNSFILEDPWDEIIGYIATLIHHQGIICGVAFPPEAGKRLLLLAAYCCIRHSRRPSAPCI
jgi:hypothetical protein